MDAGARLTATLGPSAFFLSSCWLHTVAFTTQPCVQLTPLTGRTSTGPLRLIASLRARISDDMRSVLAPRKRWLTSRLERSGIAMVAMTAMMAITVTSSTSVKPKVLAGMLDIARYGLFMVRSLPARRGSPVAGVIDHQRRARIAGLVADRGGRHREARRRATGSRNRKGVLAGEIGRHGGAKTSERRCVGAPVQEILLLVACSRGHE